MVISVNFVGLGFCCVWGGVSVGDCWVCWVWVFLLQVVWVGVFWFSFCGWGVAGGMVFVVVVLFCGSVVFVCLTIC